MVRRIRRKIIDFGEMEMYWKGHKGQPIFPDEVEVYLKGKEITNSIRDFKVFFNADSALEYKITFIPLWERFKRTIKKNVGRFKWLT